MTSQLRVNPKVQFRKHVIITTIIRSYERNGLSTDGYLKWYPPLLQNYVSNIISVDGHLIWYLALLKDYVR